MAYANASSFIDQNLAAQLFVAARAHDSLRQEPDHLLPSVIADIFTTSDHKSLHHRTTTYGALAKQHTPASQQAHHHGMTSKAGTTCVGPQESKLLFVLHSEPRVQKLINSFLGMNDKQSLMFAVTEDKSESELSDEEPRDIATSLVLSGGSLAEDVFLREREELSVLRSQYLTQLAHTRELESRMEDLQQQLDRTRCIMTNASSGDVMLLHHTAGRLHLLRELTARTFDDFFSARAQYSSWCRAQQNAYKTQAKRTIAEIKVKSEVARAAQEDALLKCRQFLKEITAGDATPSPDRPSRRRMSLSQTLPTPQQQDFAVPLDTSFAEHAERAEEILQDVRERNSRLAEQFLVSAKRRTRPEPRRPPPEQKTPQLPELERAPSPIEDATSASSSGPSLQTHIALSRPVLSREVLCSRKRHCSKRSKTGAAGSARSSSAGSAQTEQVTVPLSASAEYPPLDSLRNEVSKELQLFEQNVCAAMEHISSLAMVSVQKKFIGMDAREEDLPLFVTDAKWRIDEKSDLVSGAAEYADAIKDKLASDFDERVRKSYGSFLEQQMSRLQRIQHCCDNITA